MHIREIPAIEYRRWLASLPAADAKAAPAAEGGSAGR
jgi:hypothetical protein